MVPKKELLTGQTLFAGRKYQKGSSNIKIHFDQLKLYGKSHTVSKKAVDLFLNH